MDLQLNPGTYVVAVSGGVDSMALLHMLAQKYSDYSKSPVHLVVAHFDHGIRQDSSVDRMLVQDMAKTYNLPFVYKREDLGAKASEATARAARYEFLRKAQLAAKAKAIITAHHQNDVVETAILNLMRGTGRKGLTSLRSHPNLLRPLLSTSKQELINYAKSHNLNWREDSTNQDMSYKRNYVRHQLKLKLGSEEYKQLYSNILKLADINDEIDSLLKDCLSQQTTPHKLDRYQFVMLPHAVAREVMASWLHQTTHSSFSKGTIERACIAAKTLRPGKSLSISKCRQLHISSESLELLDLMQ